MAALSRQKINITIETNGELIVYGKAAQAKAILSAKEKRAAGTPVETILRMTRKQTKITKTMQSVIVSGQLLLWRIRKWKI